MIDIRNARVNTAGAYVAVDGLYPFHLGTKLHRGRLPVVRLGGHREEGETGWQCALREVKEETGLRIRLLEPPATYWADGDAGGGKLQVIPWDTAADPSYIPLLVISYRIEGLTLLSLMYLAEADELPTPAAEVQGLLLPDQEKIQWLCQTPHTLAEYLASGGRAALTGKFDASLVLEPFIQLRLLARILVGEGNGPSQIPPTFGHLPQMGKW